MQRTFALSTSHACRAATIARSSSLAAASSCINPITAARSATAFRSSAAISSSCFTGCTPFASASSSSFFSSPSSAAFHTSSRLHSDAPKLHGTTILAVRKGGDVVIIGDGQVSQGGTVFKPNAKKVRVIGNGKVIIGFAGATADCFALLDIFEKKLEEYSGQLLRSAVELAKMWRTDKFLRHLNAQLIAVDKDMSIILSGDGDVISEPVDGVVGIGSGGLFALAAARALIDRPDLNAREVAVKSMRIAADICVYTNTNFTIEAFENGELLVGEKRAARVAEDRANAEAAEKEMRRKIEQNTLQTQQLNTNGTVTKEQQK